jgi:hypothetical protein
MLTPYDEFPVHQSSQPFSHIPATDYSWDDGYWFAIFNPDEKVFVGVGARVNPNTDMFGGYAFVNAAGIQRTVRVSRAWRPNFELSIGPLHIRFPEPLKKIHLKLDSNDSGIDFDFLWHGTSPAYLEDHHVVTQRGRRTTEQSRYSQAGKVSGSLTLGDRSWTLDPDQWCGGRDHSWGLYVEREPLAPSARWLPPRQAGGVPRALRIWSCFRTGAISGFFHLHESSEGVQCELDDPFGSPFGGIVNHEGSDKVLHLKAGTHRIEYHAGTRIAKHAVVTLTDETGDRWLVDFTAVAPPWCPATLGYTPGSWKDGGTFHTYHGSETLALEWDEFDFSQQPFMHRPYNIKEPGAHDNFGLGFNYDKPMIGIEYLMATTITAPDGSVHRGGAHFEHFINGPYKPYGFT